MLQAESTYVVLTHGEAHADVQVQSSSVKAAISLALGVQQARDISICQGSAVASTLCEVEFMRRQLCLISALTHHVTATSCYHES